jgi:predicted dinucleotide-binding enzyme
MYSSLDRNPPKRLRYGGDLAGDDDQAKQTVAELVGSIGFRPVDVGPLVMARALEALALLNIMLQIRNNWPWQAGFKLVGPTP